MPALVTGLSALPAEERGNTVSGPHLCSRLALYGADTSSDSDWPARHPGLLILKERIRRARY